MRHSLASTLPVIATKIRSLASIYVTLLGSRFTDTFVTVTKHRALFPDLYIYKPVIVLLDTQSQECLSRTSPVQCVDRNVHNDVTSSSMPGDAFCLRIGETSQADDTTLFTSLGYDRMLQRVDPFQ